MRYSQLLACGCAGIVLGALAEASYAGAIYKYRNSKGKTLITNQPTDDPNYRLLETVRTPEYKPKASAAQAPLPAPAATEQLGMVQLDASGWKIITPGSGKKLLLEWAKPIPSYAINQQNRSRFNRSIAQIAAQHRLDPHLLHAVISAESGFNPRALSRKGAMGLMQLMPATAQRFGVANPYDPIANIRGGARYLRWLLDHFKSHKNSLQLALAGYNAGENAVVRHGYKIPPYRETQGYVSKVMRFYRHYRSGKP